MSLDYYDGSNDDESTDLGSVDWKLPIAFNEKRHQEKLVIDKHRLYGTETWRLKERMKTVSVALVMCLNVGVDPPDIVKTQPCARLECWIDPLSLSPQKALEVIGDNLQKQYERWQPRARYKQSRDPTVEEVKKLCMSLRRNAKEERVLFHYNGHGVPKPTTNGEIWVFNKSYTQYIPLSIYDLQTWMGTPSIYVYDCSNAGIIVDLFKQFATQHEQEFENLQPHTKSQFLQQNNGTPPNFHSCIQLAACGGTQILPMNPELPADLFTSCLTTPIKVALRWFVMQNTAKLIPNICLDIIEKLPGQLNDRRTLMGELNWIFTAITDTIAWNTLPRDLFQRLFRQDLLVASLFRNFLLAERIMRSYNCSPVSSPRLPSTYQHPMWQAWDLALDICLSQLHGILDNSEPFQHSLFFAEQLTAFQVWLKFGSEMRSPPEQLPIVLQVLLSQVHRLRALDLLGRFLDLGPWAVHLALSVGIFPYVLKLLQSSARELRPLLVFIWAKILAVDNTCQADLVRENGHRYFLSVLEDTRMASEHRMLAAFVLACIVKNYPGGQEMALKGNVIAICLEQLNDPNPRMRHWLALCLGHVWDNYEAARWCGVRDSAHEKLYILLVDDSPEVRASAVYALGTFIGSITERTEHANTINHSIAIKLLATVSQDGSPLVRKELVVALHYLVLQFESQFVAVAFQLMDEGSRESPYTPPSQGLVSSGGWTAAYDAGASGTGSMRRVSSRDKLKLLNSPGNAAGLNASSGSLDSTGSGDGMIASNKIKRAVSSSSIMANIGPMFSSYPMGLPYGSIYTKIWLSLMLLSVDPHPDVSLLGRTIIGSIQYKVQSSAQPREVSDTKSSPSFSAPSSPSSKPSFISGESPPANMLVSHDMHHSMITTARPLSSTHLHIPRRKLHDKSPSTIQEEAGDEPLIRKPLISTDFVEWCCKYLAQPAKMYADELDLESETYNEREWRYLRNARIRKEAESEQKRAASTRLDNQVFINKNPNTPYLLKFHPYECHLAVADKNFCSIWDWEQGLKLYQFSNMNNQSTRITSMDFINAHDHGLLMTGSDDGAVRVWRNYVPEDGKEPDLVTAWQALTDMLPSTRGSGLVLEWEQETSILYVSGDVKVIRVWDCEREIKLKDIPTGAHSCITSISLDTQTFVAGFGDGSVRVYDRRISTSDCRVATMREHTGWVVSTHVCKHGSFAGKIFTGSVAGDVKYWDPRMNTSVKTYNTSIDMTAMAVHPAADIFACGSANQFITIYSYSGENLSLIKYHDGFMGQRIGPVSCLAFHPYKVNLGAGSIDSIISVYAVDRKF